MANISQKKFPLNSDDYKLYEEVGQGVSATVYRALCIPFNEVVSIKILDLEKYDNDLDVIRREVQTMSLLGHPNLLKAHCSFTSGKRLWIVMPYMAGGSCLHIMKSDHPDGFEQPVIATLLHGVLKALVHLHSNGFIHRDVKAGNILLDANGEVKLADFGVSASLFDTGERRHKRNTFVGTPCWMAPEVMQQLHGYDFKADIWSFGITALELAHGHAPFSNYPPMKVLLMTLQNAPPGLDYERDKKFSKSFKEIVAACLVKDPKKRPTAEKLLKHRFFKHARSADYVVRTILDGLPPLGDRFRILKEKEANLLGQNKAMIGDKEQLSQQEYMRGISAWNFDLDDLKKQAALLQDDDNIISTENVDWNEKKNGGSGKLAVQEEKQLVERFNNSESAKAAPSKESLDDPPASFPSQSFQAFEGLTNIGEDDVVGSSSTWKDSGRSKFEEPLDSTLLEDDKMIGYFNGDNLVRSFTLTKDIISEHPIVLKSSCSLKNIASPSSKAISERPIVLRNSRSLKNVASLSSKANGEKDSQVQNSGRYLGQLRHHWRREHTRSASGELSYQHKDQFNVRMQDSSPKDFLNDSTNTYFGPKVTSISGVSAVLPSLWYLLQQNSMQRDQIMRFIRHVEQFTESMLPVGNDVHEQVPKASLRERILESHVMRMEQHVEKLVEDLQIQKMENAKLERQINALNGKE
nr:serine/threonine-protein kinase sid1-like isoform X2 [Ziziphus jujuba var. spinosa]